MSAEEPMVEMYPLTCDGCEKAIPVYSDKRAIFEAVILCSRCMNHPEELQARLDAQS